MDGDGAAGTGLPRSPLADQATGLVLQKEVAHLTYEALESRLEAFREELMRHIVQESNASLERHVQLLASVNSIEECQAVSSQKTPPCYAWSRAIPEMEPLTEPEDFFALRRRVDALETEKNQLAFPEKALLLECKAALGSTQETLALQQVCLDQHASLLKSQTLCRLETPSSEMSRESLDPLESPRGHGVRKIDHGVSVLLAAGPPQAPHSPSPSTASPVAALRRVALSGGGMLQKVSSGAVVGLQRVSSDSKLCNSPSPRMFEIPVSTGSSIRPLVAPSRGVEGATSPRFLPLSLPGCLVANVVPPAQPLSPRQTMPGQSPSHHVLVPPTTRASSPLLRQVDGLMKRTPSLDHASSFADAARRHMVVAQPAKRAMTFAPDAVPASIARA